MSSTLIFSEVRDHIIKLFMANVPSVGGTEVVWVQDNEEECIPLELIDKPWIRIAVRNGIGIQDTIGKSGQRWFVRDGYVYTNIYVPANDKNATMDGIASDIANIFQAKRIDETSIRFTGAAYTEHEVADGKYFEGTVRIDFTFDQLL